MLDQLIIEEQNFQLYLLENHYTFIGPENQNLLENFIKQANLIAPAVAFAGTIHHVLRNRNATIPALQILPINTPLRIYVVIPAGGPILFHATREEYCQQENIPYP